MSSSCIRRLSTAVAAGVAVVVLGAGPALGQTTPVGDADEDGVFEPAPVLESGDGGDEVMTIQGGPEPYDPVIAQSGPVAFAESPDDADGSGTVAAAALAGAAVVAAGAGTIAVRRRR